MILVSKLFTVGLWLVIFANWAVPGLFSALGANAYTVLHWTGIGLIAAHVLETALYMPKAKQAGGNQLQHALLFLVFGYVHLMEVQEQLKKAS